MTKFTEILNNIKIEVESDEQGYWYGAYSSVDGQMITNSLSYPSASECLKVTRMFAHVDIPPEIAVLKIADCPSLGEG